MVVATMARQESDRARSYKALGRRVRALRDGAGLSQAELANRAGITQTYVSNIERGISRPEPDVLRSLARTLGTTYEDLASHVGFVPRPDAPPDPIPTVDPEEAIRRLANLAITSIARKIPIQDSFAHAGEGGIEAGFVYEQPQWLEERVIALRVKGDCMAPWINDGDVVVAALDQAPEDGHVVAADVAGTAEIRFLDRARGLLTNMDDSDTIPLGEAALVVPVIGHYRNLPRLRRP